MNIKPSYQANRLCIPEGTLVVLSGLPGSGKSSLKEHQCKFIERATWLSSDELRDAISPAQTQLVSGEPRLIRHEAANAAVFAILKLRAQASLSAGRTVVIDAVNATDADRKDWVDIAESLGVPALVVILDTPLETCLERASRRLAHVSDTTIRAMAQPPAPTVPPHVVERALKNGSKVSVTVPQGFQATSRFAHHVLAPDDVLEFTWKELPDGNWDVVGDTHGLYDELVLLLQKAGWSVKEGELLPHPEGRKVLFLGDMVDRGTQSLEILRLVKRAMDAGLALALKGNHEAKLVRFIETVQAGGMERWSSCANAETGMTLLKIEPAERDALVAFMKRLPAYVLDPKSKTVFVHANITVFEPGHSTTDDAVFGLRGWKPVDSDALYQTGVEKGINRYTLVRGHIPQTSEQGHAFSLERQSFQKGELVLLHFDQVREVFEQERDSAKRIAAFKAALVTQACDFDFAQHAQRYALFKGLETLVDGKHVLRNVDESGVLRTYKYSKQTFWNNAWGESPLLLKARGIVLDPSGRIVSHPFDKVFNYLENGTGKDLADETGVVAVEKLNGFLGICSTHPLKKGELLVHTQGSFDGDFVQYIRDHLTPAIKGQVLKYLSRHDVTLMFEVIHEKDPHIIEYPAAMQGLHLLGVRGKGQSDQPWTEVQVDEAAQAMGLRRPKWERMTFGQARARVRTARDEGLMVRADTPSQEFLLKMKSPFYLTTKFLGRLSSNKTKFLFGNPVSFKQTVDEEFFVIVDAIVATYTASSFLALSDADRVVAVRTLINEMQ